MSDNGTPVQTKFCDERHTALEKRIEELRLRHDFQILGRLAEAIGGGGH